MGVGKSIKNIWNRAKEIGKIQNATVELSVPEIEGDIEEEY